MNGIASSLILKCNLFGKINADFAIFEVDENTLPLFTSTIEPDYIIALNLFRDQLDRYGEIDTIARKWKEAYSKLDKTKLVLNADDPQIAYLGDGLKNVYYFGLQDKRFETKLQQHASDSILCPRCSNRLNYEVFYFSHLGRWKCPNCKLERPTPLVSNLKFYPLLGTYALYDTLAAVLTANFLGQKTKDIDNALKQFKPAFGRQETIKIGNKNVKLFLSKNPTSFNESLRTINSLNAKNLLIILNDRIPDGTDVSWIWDIDFETLIKKNMNLYLAGDRIYDLALRIKYAEIKIPSAKIFENLEDAISEGINETKVSQIFYILPTYSAMLEARKILTGKKIL